MGYPKENYYRRIIEIQEITRKHMENGATERWVYQNHIYPVYFIVEATFYRYMGVNAKKELKKLLENK